MENCISISKKLCHFRWDAPTDNTKTVQVYLAGPMRGYGAYNFPAFDSAAHSLRMQGFQVISPTDMDRAEGFDPIKYPGAVPPELHICMARDLKAVCESDAVVVLRGWERSRGAQLEVDVARRVGKPVYWADTLLPVRLEELSFDTPQAGKDSGTTIGGDLSYLATDGYPGERTVTDPKTGGKKGQKLERFDLIPVWPLQELARIYGRGALKYDDHNWRKGYAWGLSYAALERHIKCFWAGESLDACGPDCKPDCKQHLGLHHLACAVWHCFTLMMFERNNLGTDDRKDK